MTIWNWATFNLFRIENRIKEIKSVRAYLTYSCKTIADGEFNCWGPLTTVALVGPSPLASPSKEALVPATVGERGDPSAEKEEFLWHWVTEGLKYEKKYSDGYKVMETKV